jgi:hypothetical protein
MSPKADPAPSDIRAAVANPIEPDDGSDGGRPAAIRGIAYEVEYVPPDL